MPKTTRGGKREGAGRKPSPHGATMTVKIPAKWHDDFKVWLAMKKAKKG